MAKIDFKSVGQTRQQIDDATLSGTALPIGIKSPLQFSGTDGILAMNFDLADQLTDNLKDLLLTNWGERLGQYFFGANLRPLTSEFVSQDNFDNEAVVRIKGAVTSWMPFVDLVDFTSEVDRNENFSTGIIKINISYNIPTLNVTGKKIQVVLYVM
jgi:phage baseplate assembly protein W